MQDGWKDQQRGLLREEKVVTLANQVDGRGAASRGRWKNTSGFACRTAAAEH